MAYAGLTIKKLVLTNLVRFAKIGAVAPHKKSLLYYCRRRRCQDLFFGRYDGIGSNSERKINGFGNNYTTFVNCSPTYSLCRTTAKRSACIIKIRLNFALELSNNYSHTHPHLTTYITSLLYYWRRAHLCVNANYSHSKPDHQAEPYSIAYFHAPVYTPKEILTNARARGKIGARE